MFNLHTAYIKQPKIELKTKVVLKYFFPWNSDKKFVKEVPVHLLSGIYWLTCTEPGIFL